MKKTVFDAKQWIYELLNVSSVKTGISGKLYKNKRPAESTKEDIVINSILMDNDFLQDGTFNVNCYVPYVSVSIDGISQFMPNESRLSQISQLVYPLLDNIFRDKFNLTIERHETIEVESEKSSYLNFRINLKAYN